MVKKSKKTPSAKKKTPVVPDAELWETVKDGIKPLKNNKKIPKDIPLPDSGIKAPPTTKKKPVPAAPTDPPPASKQGKNVSVNHRTNHNRMDKRTATNLKRGKYTIEARLDLHGMTRTNAYDALGRFLMHCRAQGKRTVLVITGKGRVSEGGGVIRRSVPEWLQTDFDADVSGYCTAQPKDGGTGALYIRLRK